MVGVESDEDGVRYGQRDAWLHSIRDWHAKRDMWKLDTSSLLHAILVLMKKSVQSYLLFLVFFFKSGFLLK